MSQKCGRNSKLTGKVTPIDEARKQEAKLDQLTTYDVSDLWSLAGLGGTRYNPDDLVGKKGITIYSKMLVDEQVKAVTEFKLASIMARGYEFVYEASSKLSNDEQKARIAVFEGMVSRMRGSFDDVIENVSTGREYGFSISEKVLGSIEVNGKAYTGINKIVLRNPGSFQFIADDYGELVRIEQLIGKAKPITVAPTDIIHYVNKPKWDQFYGRSELRAAYVWWYIKDQVLKMWPRYLEKFAGGIAVATRETDDAPQSGTPEYVRLQEALSKMISLSSIYLPKGVKLDVKFPSTTDAYEKCLVFCDLAIAKSQLVPNLLGLSHTGQTGAFAQSQTQFEAYLWTTKQSATSLASVLNEQLFYGLGEAAWGDDEYPCFRFKPASFEHVKWMLESWGKLVSGDSVVVSEEDERYIRKLLEMPERKPGEVLRNPLEEERIKREQDNLAASQKAQADALNKQGEQFVAMFNRLAERIPVAPTTQTVNIQPTHQRLPHMQQPAHALPLDELDIGGVPSAVFNRALERVNFAVIEQRTGAIETYQTSRIAGQIASAVRRALGDDAHLRELVDDDPADIAAFDINTADRGKLRKSMAELLSTAWKIGSDMASNEIDRARGALTPAHLRRERFASLRNNAAAFFDARAFRMAGDASDQTRKMIQTALQNAVKSGKPLNEVRIDIWDALVSKGLTTQEAVRGIETDAAVNAALDALWLDTEQEATAYLNTLVRTNTFEALNEARYAEFTDPALADFIVALRYAAVLDSSTTQICEELNNNTYRADSQVWAEYRPPNHFNCRSVLVPITVIDGWDGIEDPPPTIEPQEGFH